VLKVLEHLLKQVMDLKYNLVLVVGMLKQMKMVELTSTVPGQSNQHPTCMVDSPTQDNINK